MQKGKCSGRQRNKWNWDWIWRNWMFCGNMQCREVWREWNGICGEYCEGSKQAVSSGMKGNETEKALWCETNGKWSVDCGICKL